MKPAGKKEKITYVKIFSGVKILSPVFLTIISPGDSVKGFEIARAFVILKMPESGPRKTGPDIRKSVRHIF